MYDEKLLIIFKELFGWDVKTHLRIEPHVIEVNDTYIFTYYGPKSFRLETRGLGMDHKELALTFKLLFGWNVETYKRIDPHTIEVNNTYIFTYYNQNSWRLETK